MHNFTRNSYLVMIIAIAIELRLFSECCSANQEIPRIYGTRFFTGVFKRACLPLVPVRSQINHSHINLFTINFEIISLFTHRYPGWFLPSEFPTRTLYELLFSVMCAICPAQFILYHSIVLINI